MKSISVHSLAFEGTLLERGFWLYIWDVRRAREERFLYVGRTGDSSSPNAASPFNRMGLHLNLKHNAKANSLVRQIEVRSLPCEVPVSASEGMPSACVINADNLHTIPKGRLRRRIAELPSEKRFALDQALRHSLDLEL